MVSPPESPFPLVLLILDGWGESPETDHNAIHHCRPESIEALGAAWPSTLVQASGPVVGLPAGKMGNSEAGHLCIGSGRSMRCTTLCQNGWRRRKSPRRHKNGFGIR